MTHIRDNCYQCRHCGKEFKRGEHIQIHVNTHTGEKPYQWSYCGKTFSDNGKILKHINTLTETWEKSYQCSIFKNALIYDYLLKRHVKTHTEEKQYQCEHCQKFFHKVITLWGILRHIPELERSYQCSICEKAFN